jgi:hypothetical protein
LQQALSQGQGLKLRLSESERELERMNQMLELKEELVGSKDDIIRQMDKTMRSNEERIKMMNDVITLKDECTEQDKRPSKTGNRSCIDTNVAYLDKDNLVAGKDVVIQELKNKIKILEDNVRGKERSRQQLETAVLRKNDKIKTLEKESRERGRSIEDLQGTIRQLEVAIKNQENTYGMKDQVPQLSELLLRDQIRQKNERLSKLEEELSASRRYIQSLRESTAAENANKMDNVNLNPETPSSSLPQATPLASKAVEVVAEGPSTTGTTLGKTNSTDPFQAHDSFILLESATKGLDTNGMTARASDPTWREAAVSILQDLAPNKPTAGPTGTDAPAEAIQTPIAAEIASFSSPKVLNFQNSPVMVTPTQPTGPKDPPSTVPKTFTFQAPRKTSSVNIRSSPDSLQLISATPRPSIYEKPQREDRECSHIGHKLGHLRTGYETTKTRDVRLLGYNLETFVCANCGKTGHRSLLCTDPCAVCGVTGHTRIECNGVGPQPTSAPSTTPANASWPNSGVATESTLAIIPCLNCAKPGDHHTIHCKAACGACGTMGHFRHQCKEAEYEPQPTFFNVASSIPGPTSDPPNINVEVTSGDSSGDVARQKKRKLADVDMTEAGITEGAKRIKIEEE